MCLLQVIYQTDIDFKIEKFNSDLPIDIIEPFHSDLFLS